MFGTRLILYSIAVLAFAGPMAALLFRQRRSAVDGTVAALIASSLENYQALPSPEDLEDVPEPVRRYLAWALPEPRQIRVARLSQSGEVRTNPIEGKWMSFEAEHLAVTTSPGFVWNARVSVVPFMHVRVVDSLVQGEGAGQVSLMSVIPMGSEAGS